MKSRRLIVLAAAAMLGVVAVAELFSRFALGLGDPPLTLRDGEIDYLFAPGVYHRFGNLISYNAFSMRADEVTPDKTDPNELRVLVIGDSVINGGALTDDSQLATRIAQERLTTALQRPVWVGNISAGSWGPGNQLAYLRKFGSFDADIAILVLSTHDIADVPDFVPDLGTDFPERPPVLALEEAVGRYLPRYVPWLRTAAAVAEPMPQDAARARAKGARELDALLDQLKKQVPHVVVLHHEERGESTRSPSEDAVALRREVEAATVPNLELRPYLARALGNESPYRDDIHVNEQGQRLYAEALTCVTLVSLGLSAGDCA